MVKNTFAPKNVMGAVPLYLTLFWSTWLNWIIKKQLVKLEICDMLNEFKYCVKNEDWYKKYRSHTAKTLF